MKDYSMPGHLQLLGSQQQTLSCWTGFSKTLAVGWLACYLWKRCKLQVHAIGCCLHVCCAQPEEASGAVEYPVGQLERDCEGVSCVQLEGGCATTFGVVPERGFEAVCCVELERSFEAVCCAELQKG